MRTEFIIRLLSPKPAGYDQQAGTRIKAKGYTTGAERTHNLQAGKHVGAERTRK